MENGQQEVQPGIPLSRTLSKLPDDLSQRDRCQRPYGNHQRLEFHQEVQTAGGEGKKYKGESCHYPSYRRTADPDREYSDSFRITRSWPNQLSSGFTLFRNQQISGQESPFFTIPGSFQEKTRIQGQKQDHLQPEEGRVRPNDPEAVGFGERSEQEPEVVVNNSRISSPINRNITPTQIEHNVATPETTLHSDSLWLQMSQFSEQTQKQFAELEASHERIKILTASMDKMFKNLQKGHSHLRKASEETNKRLNLLFEEQHHRKRDRDCLDQNINKLFNVYHNMKPQPQGHVMDNTYHQDDIKPDPIPMNKARSPSQYPDGDNMSYSEKEALKQLPEASSWPKFSGTGEYDHMELIDYVDGLFIDVPSIPDYCITDRLNTAFKGNSSIWYTEINKIHGGRAKSSKITTMMRNHKLLTQIPGELEHAVKCRCNHNFTLDDIANTIQDVRKRTNIGKYTPYKSIGFKEKQPFRVEFRDKPTERVAEVEKKKNSSHNCGSTDHYANNCPKSKKKVYPIEEVPEEESPTEDSDSDSMADAIREQSEEEQGPREEFLGEYQEEAPLEIQYIQLEQEFHKTLPTKSCANTYKMHKHSWSHQPKEWHTYMGKPQT
ncbi:hypothetical protein O181_009327 [Austropuccinia psidii MF-1]|uniref:Uncharacterized protein n=1 Tax=Austropuccinia psidii MF-1 TaxID=1389203 RepID=A0A9Q3BQL4_9BASI|nr:hypothetical protein [Austropuccinia psidii MF-1]